MCTRFKDKAVSLKPEFHCPSHCQKKELKDASLFSIESDGNLTLKTNWTNEAEVHDYCAAYYCSSSDQGWGVTVEACVCAKHSAIEQLNKVDYQGIDKCCPTLTKIHDQNLNCANLVKSTCPHDFYKSVKVTDISAVSATDIKFKESIFSSESVTLTKGKDQYCVGFQYSNAGKVDTLIQTSLFYCPASPCSDGEPCIRTCCDNGKRGKKCNGAVVTTTEMKDYEQLKQFANDSNFARYFAKASRLQNECGIGKKMDYLTMDKCTQRFDLDMNPSSKEVSLMHMYGQQTLGPNDFCLYFEENDQLSAKYCVEKKSMAKFSFYPILLVTSCVFLLLTIAIYLWFYKKLITTYYTRIMMNFAGMMFLAFLILAINQLHSFAIEDPGICITFGFVQQYAFLSAFALMTVMSTEVMLQINGSLENAKRFRIGLIFGYTLPLIISVLTGITEATLDCSPFKPNFGENTCFFDNLEAKAVWFYLPIGLFLLVNITMFVMTVIRLYSVDAEQRKVNGKRTDKYDRFVIYLRLFLGMGAIWIFEIFAGLTDDYVHESVWYFTDVLNMFQGVYVFVIFVCKRNVIFAILGVKDKRNTTVASTLKQRLLPKRLTELRETQTEMVSLNSMSTSNTSASKKVKEPNPRALAQSTAAY